MSDLTSETLLEILDLAEALQQEKEQNGFIKPLLKGKTVAMTFEKPSLRTRAAFEIATADLGAHPIFFGPQEIFLSKEGGDRETISDIVHNIERFADAIVARVFAHDSIATMTEISSVPVINALCDQHHPTQAICDLLAIRRHFGGFKNLTLAWIGDGNNVCASLAQATALVGIRFRASSPEEYRLPASITDRLANYEFCRDPLDAAKDTDIVVTDTWVSMGSETEGIKRRKVFAPFQVTSHIMANAKDSAIFMHCLPAHRGEEVTAEVIDGKQSIVFDEAICRLYIARALLVKLILGSA